MGEQNKKKDGRRRRFNHGIRDEFPKKTSEGITIADEQNKKKGRRRRSFNHGIRDEFAKKISEKLNERDISRSEKKNNLIDNDKDTVEKRVDNNGRENKLIKEIEEGIKENDKEMKENDKGMK